MTLSRRQIIVLALSGIIVGAGAAGMWFRSHRQVEINTYIVTHQNNYPVVATGRGQIQAGSEGYLAVKKGGRLDHVYIQVGSTVKAGQIVAALDVGTNRAGLESALSSYHLATTEFHRLESLYRAHAAPAQELDQARSTYTVRHAELQQAKERLEDSLVRVATGGVLTNFAFKVGDFVPDGARVAIVEDRGSYRLLISVPAQYREQLPPHATVTLAHLDPQTMTATSAVAYEGDIRLANPTSNYDGMDIDVLVTFATLPAGFTVGASVQVKIPLHTLPAVAQIPVAGISWRDDKPHALLVDANGHLAWHEIKLLETSGDKAVVLGLSDVKNAVLPDRPEIFDAAIARGASVKVHVNSVKGG